MATQSIFAIALLLRSVVFYKLRLSLVAMNHTVNACHDSISSGTAIGKCAISKAVKLCLPAAKAITVLNVYYLHAAERNRMMRQMRIVVWTYTLTEKALEGRQERMYLSEKWQNKDC